MPASQQGSVECVAWLAADEARVTCPVALRQGGQVQPGENGHGQLGGQQADSVQLAGVHGGSGGGMAPVAAQRLLQPSHLRVAQPVDQTTQAAASSR